MRSILRPTVLLFALLGLGLISSPGHAQVLGPFTMQLAPFCNVITFTVADQGPAFNLSGFDDNCGGATRLSASGNVFFNPNGTVGGGLSIIATGQAGSQVALTIAEPLRPRPPAARPPSAHRRAALPGLRELTVPLRAAER